MPTAAEQALLATINSADFDIRMTNIKTDQECSVGAWLKKVRKNIVYLPEDFPLEMLYASVQQRWQWSEKKAFDLLRVETADALKKFKNSVGSFDWLAYFVSIAYEGIPEKFLLIIKPEQKSDPVFYQILFRSPSSVIILAHQSESLRYLDVSDLNQYAFFRYTDKTTEELLGLGNELLDPDGGFEQQSLDTMVMSSYLRGKKTDLSSCQSRFDLARMCVERAGLSEQCVKRVILMTYQNFLAGSDCLLSADIMTPVDLIVLKESGLIQLQNDGYQQGLCDRYYFISRTVHLYLAACYLVSHLKELEGLVKTYKSNVYLMRIMPVVYWLALKVNFLLDNDLAIIEGYLLDPEIPNEIKGECYQFFSMFYVGNAVTDFFCAYPEFRQYIPDDLNEAYRDKLKERQQAGLAPQAQPNLLAAALPAAISPPRIVTPDTAAATLPAAVVRPTAVTLPVAVVAKLPRVASVVSLPLAMFFDSAEVDLELGTDEVMYYLDAKVVQACGGYRKISGLNNSYLLEKLQREDGRDYLVAVLPSTETSGRYVGDAFVAIDFYLDGSQRGGDGRSAYLHKMMTEGYPEENFEILKSFDDEMVLAASIESLMGENVLDKGAITSVYNIIKKSKDTGSLMHEIAKIKMMPDVFTELHEFANFFQVDHDQHCKILFPFNLGNSHWVSVEIQIHKREHHYECFVYLYDPQYSQAEGGRSQLQESHFNKIKSAIERRIKHYDAQAKIAVENRINPYHEARQAVDNIVDCGIYAVCDIVTRIAGKPLVPYAQSSLNLREEMVDLMNIAAATMREANDSRAEAVARFARQNAVRLQQYQSLRAASAVASASFRNEVFPVARV